MKFFFILFVLFFCFSSDVCRVVWGASLVAQDDSNTFLGKIENEFSSNSIFNEFSEFGSEFGAKSVFNEFSRFRGYCSSYSANNSVARTPPMIIKHGKIIGFLSTNKTISNSISPNLLKALCKDF